MSHTSFTLHLSGAYLKLPSRSLRAEITLHRVQALVFHRGHRVVAGYQGDIALVDRSCMLARLRPSWFHCPPLTTVSFAPICCCTCRRNSCGCESGTNGSGVPPFRARLRRQIPACGPTRSLRLRCSRLATTLDPVFSGWPSRLDQYPPVGHRHLRSVAFHHSPPRVISAISTRTLLNMTNAWVPPGTSVSHTVHFRTLFRCREHQENPGSPYSQAPPAAGRSAQSSDAWSGTGASLRAPGFFRRDSCPHSPAALPRFPRAARNHT